jgi:hypothetical protein
MLNDLSRFNSVGDYFPIIIAGLIVDMFVLCLVLVGYINVKSLNQWYNNFQLLAVVADVFSIVIGIIIARFIYSFFFKSYSLMTFLILVCGVQLVHDLLFAAFFNGVPRNKSKILDIFKDYAKEVGFKILGVDALMMIGTVLLGSYLATWSFNSMIILSIVCMYILPYLLYSINA